MQATTPRQGIVVLQASLDTLAAVTTGRLDAGPAALADGLGRVFDAAIRAPWCYLVAVGPRAGQQARTAAQVVPVIADRRALAGTHDLLASGAVQSAALELARRLLPRSKALRSTENYWFSSL
jgi:hypothetical protein